MDQQGNEDRPWKDCQGLMPDDIIKKFEEIGPTAYPHQYEFIQYCLGQSVDKQAPVIGLRSLTGSGKTLCFQSLIYSNYNKQIHGQIFQMKQLKQRDGSMKEGRVLYPYSIVLGQTVYLKQHEENFTKYLPDRLQNDGLKFQTFYAFTKDQDKQFQKAENKIEDAYANVLLCHPSKLMTGIKMRIINVSNLRYLIIDEADQLLAKDERNEARNETIRILQFILGQSQNPQFQLIFVSASLKQNDIDELVRECVQNNFNEGKKIDKRFGVVEDGLSRIEFEVKMLPSNYSDKIAPYSITHYYIDSKDPLENTLANLIKSIYEWVPETQIMVFFNTKVATKEIKDALMKNSELAFLVKNDFIIECTGDTNQMQRENVRAEFKEGKKKVLLCTDVLQRGLDFRKVRAIVHYGLPADPSGAFKEESYFQRSGRTGRAKDEGVVVTLLTKEDLEKKRNEQLTKALEKAQSKVVMYEDGKFIKDLEKAMKYNKE